MVEVETMEREEYEALLKAEGVEIQDAFKKMRDMEGAIIGDPTKALEV